MNFVPKIQPGNFSGERHSQVFQSGKGFGFITPDGGGQDVFVHVSSVAGSTFLREGQTVSYEVGQDKRTGKSKAESVRGTYSSPAEPLTSIGCQLFRHQGTLSDSRRLVG